ncbi:DUF4350 domain-containing protein [Actinomadura alba]|uniref:DUF4350 domain-containing protein n=1 Tax=Actinomadura alba TaxID=406431 RepID=A0ABR7LJL1_9ACTN|nr:DUF4350 domain-containing protein [Actinomadura alba]MBC6464868.1 DUF4350 domain-containing protein [Actinomadura alba]
MTSVQPPQTTEPSGPTEPSEGTTAAQVVRRRWRSARYVVLTVLALLILVVILAALRPTVQPQYLDPESPGQSGTRALAQILGDRGVGVEVTRNASAAVSRMAGNTDATLVVVRSERLTEDDLEILSRARGDVLLVEPRQRVLDRLAPGVRLAARIPGQHAAPGCELTAATMAGEIDFNLSYTYLAPASAVRCYPTEALPRLVRLPVEGHTVTVLGSGLPLTNEHLAEDGNAALGMNLAGERSSVVWLIPDLPPAGGDQEKSLGELIPAGVKLAILQLVVALALVALWRSRRLGPVVVEPLPVVVRSAETVEGRARLYRAQHARDRAADALRAGARERLVPLLGLPRSSAQDPAFAQEVVAALAARAPWDATAIGLALYGPAPADDAELVRLTDFLDDLERQVRQS